MSEWLTDPDGNLYQYVGNYPDRIAVYKTAPDKQPSTPFKRFLVTVRGSLFHVSAPDAADAARLFWSESIAGLPRRDEVSVKEVG